MLVERSAVAFPVQALGSAYEQLVGSIGSLRFQTELSRFLGDSCGADHMHVFSFDGERPQIIASASLDGSAGADGQTASYLARTLWHYDQAMAQGRQVALSSPALFRVPRQAANRQLLDFYRCHSLSERLMAFARGPDGVIGVNLVRSECRGPLPSENMSGVDAALGMVLPLVARHIALVTSSQRVVRALTDLPLIERVLELSGRTIPLRERQVAARMLYGLTGVGVASDLGIGPETVITYRKRIYERLQIGCHHELLLWYMRVYGETSPSLGC
jgi:DNA-binding CsgD family transcriptional regulator